MVPYLFHTSLAILVARGTMATMAPAAKVLATESPQTPAAPHLLHMAAKFSLNRLWGSRAINHKPMGHSYRIPMYIYNEHLLRAH
jgi:hypothetical protein